MKIKINWLAIIAIIALVFCVAYLITHLIVKRLYVDSLFAAAIVILFPCLVYGITNGT